MPKNYIRLTLSKGAQNPKFLGPVHCQWNVKRNAKIILVIRNVKIVLFSDVGKSN